MKHILFALIALSILFIGIAGNNPAFVFGQDSSATDESWEPNRLADGQPDIQGIYINPWVFTIENYTDQEREEFQQAMIEHRGPETGAYDFDWLEQSTTERRADYPYPDNFYGVSKPPSGRIPWQDWAFQKKKYLSHHPYEKREFFDSRIRCLPAGTPRGFFWSFYNGWQILQPPGHVVILYEHNHLYRVIPLDDSPHLGKDINLWMGDSRGRWEGNTLVVDVTNLTDKTWVIGELGGEGIHIGSFHSEDIHVVERFTIVDKDNIDYEVTIEDPNVFTEPWSMKYRVFTRAPKDYVLFEYACHEGNRTMELTFGDTRD